MVHHCALILYAALLIGGTSSDLRNVESFLSELMLEEPVDEAKCDRTMLEVAAADSATVIDTLPRLHGKWVSQDCEVRPGPEFLLRSYTFLKANTFKLLQFYYGDESCILPWYTISAKGMLFLRGGSWVTTGATEADYALTKVTVHPQTTEMAEELSRTVNKTCPGLVRKTWKPHREYVIYRMQSFGEELEGLETRGKSQKATVREDFDCLAALGLEFNELQLVRSQTRPVEDKKNRELFLGDIHSSQKSRFTYKPTAFQTPLLKVEQSYQCGNCHIIAKGTERSPPHLMSRPRLPPLPHGQWVSRRCEVRPMGMFLIRRLSFDSRDHSWIGEYTFHSDPSCVVAAFSISASGRYAKGRSKNRDKMKHTYLGTELDFKVDRARLTIFDVTLRETFDSQKDCGLGPWTVGISKDLGPTRGCAMLGLLIPVTEYELIKLEIDNQGTPLLYMGLPDTENKRRSFLERPTSYQPPLIQCSTSPFPNDLDTNQVHPMSYARTAARSKSTFLHQKQFYKMIIISFLIAALH